MLLSRILSDFGHCKLLIKNLPSLYVASAQVNVQGTIQNLRFLSSSDSKDVSPRPHVKDQFHRIKAFVECEPEIVKAINQEYALPYADLSVLMKSWNSDKQYSAEPTSSSLYDFFADGHIMKPSVNIKYVMENKHEVAENAKLRKTKKIDLEYIIGLYNRMVKLDKAIQQYRSMGKPVDSSLSVNKSSSSSDSSDELNHEKTHIDLLEGQIHAENIIKLLQWIRKDVEKSYFLEAFAIPNQTHPETPPHSACRDETVIETVGNKPSFDHEIYDHIFIGKKLRILRQERMSRMFGQRNYFLYGSGAELEQALVQFTIDRLKKKNFIFMSTPNIIKDSAFEGAGNITGKMDKIIYNVGNIGNGDFCLAGTSEIGLCGHFSSHAVREKELPLRICSVSTCYRKETGTRLDPKGLFRVHQFLKVEMFGITANETGTESEELLQEFVSIQKENFEELGLHFDVVNMPVSDLGLPAYRKIDMEAWFPGRDKYDEISSASNCTDFQARRLHILYKKNQEYKFAHTVNATACAVPRLIIALLENGQRANREVSLPSCLHPYMNGKTSLRKEKHFLEYIGVEQSKNKQASPE